MLFADSTLAARIDRAEARLCTRLAGGQGQHLVRPIGGGAAIYAGPRSPMNKVIGLGFDAPDWTALAEIEDRWRERGEPVRIELATLTDPAIGAELSDRGYRLRGFENVLARRLDSLPPQTAVSPGVTIEQVADDDLDEWFRIAVDAFASMDGTGSVADEALPREQLEQALGDLLGATGMSRYLARVDGAAAGEAALSIEDNLAQLAGSGTAPAFRGRGVQKALVQRRLQDARAAGCDIAVVVTAPGSRSQDNVMRRGFDLLYARAILIKDW